MNINKEHLDAIYETLADKLDSDDIVSSYMQKFPGATKFAYRGEKQSFSTIFYWHNGLDKAVKLVDLSDISCHKDFLDKVLEDASELIKYAREERKVLEFYLEKIKNL